MEETNSQSQITLVGPAVHTCEPCMSQAEAEDGEFTTSSGCADRELDASSPVRVVYWDLVANDGENENKHQTRTDQPQDSLQPLGEHQSSKSSIDCTQNWSQGRFSGGCA